MPEQEMSAVLERIRYLAVAHQLLVESPFAAHELRLEHRLVEDLLLDSIALLTFAVEVENDFEVAFTEEDDASLRTVGDFVRRVSELRSTMKDGG